MKKVLFAFLASFIILSTSCGEKIPKDFVLVEGGTFRMGVELSDELWDEVNQYDFEGIRSKMTLSQMKKAAEKNGILPYFVAHTVKLNSFYMCKHEVTQAEYTEIMGENPSDNKENDDFPVGEVSWSKAVEYCNKRSEKEGLTPCYLKNGKDYLWDFRANGYRLPTEAEWEFAARGGNKSKGYKYSGSNDASEIAWVEYSESAGLYELGEYHEVMTKAPNELGIFDMTGNMLEWCWDWYAAPWWEGEEPLDNPTGAESDAFVRLLWHKDIDLAVNKNDGGRVIRDINITGETISPVYMRFYNISDISGTGFRVVRSKK